MRRTVCAFFCAIFCVLSLIVPSLVGGELTDTEIDDLLGGAQVNGAASSQEDGPSCFWEYDVEFVGNDLPIASLPEIHPCPANTCPAGDSGIQDPFTCKQLCRATPGCDFFSYSNTNAGRCWLKSAKTGREKKKKGDNFVSGPAWCAGGESIEKQFSGWVWGVL